MIRQLNRTEIDDTRWNELIDASQTPLPYAYTWYLDVMSSGWNALVDGDYEYVMPLTVGKKFGFNYLYQPYFTQQLGVFSKHDIKHETTQTFLNEVKKHFSFVQIHFHYNHQPVAQNDFTFQPRRTSLLPLNNSYHNIHAAFNNSLRKNVREAERKNLTVTRDESASWLIDTFRASKGKDVKDLQADDYTRLEKLIETAVEKKCGHVYTVFNGSEKIASSFILHNHRYVIALFSFSNAAGRTMNGMSYLYNCVIRDFSGNDMVFDFEGSQIPSINLFNRSFGSKPVTYWMLYRNALPWHIRLIKKLKDAL